MDTWILQMCRRSCLRQVMAWAAVIAGSLILLAVNTRYVSNFVSGPYDFTANDLEQVRDVDTTPRYFVRVSGTKTLESGVTEITVRKRNGVEVGRQESANYYYLAVGRKFLLVKLPAGQATVVEGELKPTPADLQSHLFDTTKMPSDLATYTYPFYLDTTSFRTAGYWAIGIAVVLGFFLVKHGLPAWRRLQNLASHPVMLRVSNWGDPLTISQEVKGEYDGNRAFKLGNHVITDNYIIELSFFRFELLRFRSLLWAYKTVTKHSVNFIPTGKTYRANLICYGGTAAIDAKEERVNSLLEFAAKIAPWAVFGYSKEIETLFNKSTDEFCAAVEKRKAEMRMG